MYGVIYVSRHFPLKDLSPIVTDHGVPPHITATKVVVGASFALPLASLCICKHLEMVSSSRKVRFDNADKRRRMIFEIIMCFGVPTIFMVLREFLLS